MIKAKQNLFHEISQKTQNLRDSPFYTKILFRFAKKKTIIFVYEQLDLVCHLYVRSNYICSSVHAAYVCVELKRHQKKGGGLDNL